jgi:hypothetical protein
LDATTTDDTSTNDTPCVVYLLSDRQLTIDILKTYIETKWNKCHVVLATHKTDSDTDTDNNNNKTTTTNGHYQEHGPFAGTGFFQDLIVASQARHGFIGHCYRTSSQLLREWIFYDRTMEAMERTGKPPTRSLPVCCLPSTVNA